MTSSGTVGVRSRQGIGGCAFIVGLIKVVVTACGGSGVTEAPVASPVDRQAAGIGETCATNRAVCEVGDISIGGGTVFYVEGGGDEKVVLEYAPAGWYGESLDPMMTWDDAVQAAADYELVRGYKWHLASNDELVKLYEYWKKTKAGGIQVDGNRQHYWVFDCCTIAGRGGALSTSSIHDKEGKRSGVRALKVELRVFARFVRTNYLPFYSREGHLTKEAR